MEGVRVWVEKTTIPTYEIGEAEKNPIFLEKRVYQGSCGKVYPYPTVEKISENKVDKEYEAVYLENDYLKVMVLPSLGGRIQRAYDKTNGYDFIYYNHVIKPALVGLTGPWISGGIEFNWPQHHRPTTFLPVDYEIRENEDGSCSVLCHDVDQMYGTKGIAKITLYPGKAYIEINGQLYNRTSLPQTFLWWANPAVAVNENTQSVFPPDVHAVMDHGKRDVSRFPIATGVYYKHDYSEGVDISRYSNIPVPTSYMAEKSNYDFVGGYDYGVEAGILHVADHHVSPGKKQWTWGCGDFGKAWDRNLTDEDGPYVELMTGVFTDNQPDFSWLAPFEEKTFTQYFMPYKKLGYVKNANKDVAVALDITDGKIKVSVYATGEIKDAQVVLTYNDVPVMTKMTELSPVDIFEETINCEEIYKKANVFEETINWEKIYKNASVFEKTINKETHEKENILEKNNSEIRNSALSNHNENSSLKELEEEKFYLAVFADGKCLISFKPERKEIHKLPEPAYAADSPEKIQTNEELYLTGLHIEQYRHATYMPDPYYLEGLKRDPGDIRINNAYGTLLMRRGDFKGAQPYFEKALERLCMRNPNPYDSEAYYLLGLDLWYQGKMDEAYDAFYKATWSNKEQEMSFYYLAAIDSQRCKWYKALEHIERALIKNTHNIKARGLKAYLLRKTGQYEAAKKWIEESLAIDSFDFVCGYEGFILENDDSVRLMWNEKLRGFRENYLMTARDYAEFGAYEEAIEVLEEATESFPLIEYYKAFYISKCGNEKEALDVLKKAEACDPSYCFPNKLEDIEVLQFAINNGCNKKAPYYLGNLFYDRTMWQEALELWEMAAQNDKEFPTVYRNLALVYYNKCKDGAKAKSAMERAFSLNENDVRVFLELDQLYRKFGWSFEERLVNYEKYHHLIEERDDLYTEYITLVNMSGQHRKAYECMMKHHFHPWEGGEGKITTQYVIALLEMAKEEIKNGKYDSAVSMLNNALTYPENLGEGKLEGTKDNHIYYYLGITYEKMAQNADGADKEKLNNQAREYFELATLGTDEPAGALFYNDQPADMILYQGLSYQKLGLSTKAKARFYRLIDYGEQHLEDEGSVGYFAVSLPDFLVFEEDYTKRNRVHCLYLMALGNIGVGDINKARNYLEEAVRLEPSHIMCRIYQSMLEV